LQGHLQPSVRRCSHLEVPTGTILSDSTPVSQT